MVNKEIFYFEYIFKILLKVFEKMIIIFDGLSEWFVDDVNVKEEIYMFSWDGSEEEVRFIFRKVGEGIWLYWLYDDDDDIYVEMCYIIDLLIKVVIFWIIDFVEKSELIIIKRMWELYVVDLCCVFGV